VKFGRREVGEIARCVPDQKKKKFRFALSLLLLRRSHPKSARAKGKQCNQTVQKYFIQIG